MAEEGKRGLRLERWLSCRHGSGSTPAIPVPWGPQLASGLHRLLDAQGARICMQAHNKFFFNKKGRGEMLSALQTPLQQVN